MLVAGPRKKPSSIMAHAAVMLPVSTERRMRRLIARSLLLSACEFFFAVVSWAQRAVSAVVRGVTSVRATRYVPGTPWKWQSAAGGTTSAWSRMKSKTQTHDVRTGPSAEPDGRLGEEREQLGDVLEVRDLRNGQ